jgi:(p)ppGpp synthase/HD superfamily hydrolase
MEKNHNVQLISKGDFLSFIEGEAKLRLDDFIDGAIEVAEEIHFGVKREDNLSPFLETHTWPVTIDVIKHYRSLNRHITSVEIACAILHDVLEDNDRILDLYQTKAYGFEAYLSYRFGNRIYKMATELKIRPLENYAGTTDEERQLSRFQNYCDLLMSAEYDVKVIKLADRLNNMKFIISSAISTTPTKLIQEKIKRYLREAEDFYLAYTMLTPKMPNYYVRLRSAFNELRSVHYEHNVSVNASLNKL